MAKKIYQITQVSSGKPVPGLFFMDKSAAKAKRKELNGDESHPAALKYVVSPGPDHPLVLHRERMKGKQ